MDHVRDHDESAPDREAGKPLRLLPRHIDTVHFGAARAVAAPGDERVDLLVRAFEDSLDRAVGAVSHPAGDAAHLRLTDEREAKADTLDAAAHDDPAADHDGRHSKAARCTSELASS